MSRAPLPAGMIPPKRPPSLARGQPDMLNRTRLDAIGASFTCRYAWSAIILCLLAGLPAAAAPPSEPVKRAAVIGQPTALVVQPESLSLSGPRARQQLVVSGRYADGSVRDLTALCEFETDPSGTVSVEDGGWLSPRKQGPGKITVKAGGKSTELAVTVKDFDKPQPVSFHNEFIGAVNVGGCNQGACHGTPSGKAGFKLSLRGYDPDADYLQLTRDALGRRTDGNGDASLIMQKALGRVPHEGGQRFKPNSIPALTMRSWLEQGLQNDLANFPRVKSVQILPGSRVLNQPAR